MPPESRIDIGKGSRVRVVGGDIHDNPGSALAVRAGATASMSHSVFARNGASAGAPTVMVVEDRGVADLTANVFVGGQPERPDRVERGARRVRPQQLVRRRATTCRDAADAARSPRAPPGRR